MPFSFFHIENCTLTTGGAYSKARRTEGSRTSGRSDIQKRAA